MIGLWGQQMLKPMLQICSGPTANGKVAVRCVFASIQKERPAFGGKVSDRQRFHGRAAFSRTQACLEALGKQSGMELNPKSPEMAGHVLACGTTNRWTLF